jgi:hypothetical protein
MKRIFGWIMAGLIVLAAGAVQAEEGKSTSEAATIKPVLVSTPVAKAKKRKAVKPKATKPQASMKPVVKDIYVCPMCDIKSDKPGQCPHCGMEMVKDVPKDPNAKVVYRCDRCGIEADKPGECPHHCGGTLVVKE